MKLFSRQTATSACILALLALHGAEQTHSQDVVYRGAMANAVRDAANRFLPSVVTVEIIGAVGQADGEVEQDAPTSGIVVDDSGFILASSIVVRRPSASILVVLPDRTRHAATVVAKDQHRELILLKIKTDKQLVAVDLPSKLDLRVGQTTIAVGRYGADASPIVSNGVLSATQRLDGIALQTDARVSPAFYGGPLIDLAGNLLGVLVPAVAPGGAPDATSWYDSGIAFAIPADVIQRKLERLKAGTDINKGLIGIVPKTDDPLKAGTKLAAVRTRSPAELGGLKPGDEITSLAGQKVKRFQQIKQILGSYDAGETISIEFARDGKSQSVEIELIDSIPPLQPQRLGFIAREETVTDKDDDAEDPKEGDDAKLSVVVDQILPGSPAEGQLKGGDVILNVNEATASDTQSLRSLMVAAEPGKVMTIQVLRDKEEKTIFVTPASIAGPIADEVPEAWEKQGEKEWKVSPLKLPDVSNAAAFVGPDDDDESTEQLGLLVMLLNPGQGKPEKVLESWPNLARQHGVVVCAIAPAADERWRSKEIDVVSRFAGAILKKVTIEESAVAVAASGALDGGKAEAGDSMALAVAISASETFFGVAISHEARPPAVRLRENEADASLQLLLPIKSADDLPTWGTALQKSGYPVVFGGATDSQRLLKWVRLLQSI
ncbi:PDZ domain-containing protein [Planctomycetes bacterium K23_9]|uniref:Periplasmic serine endoprotease DegP n=1 Tax=Stieleria marina TaxID=1930275 RepID=A0A517NZ96_9BACT|nr:Periplasmic serine endoprotease DegP precursor [Planctomycetes bacterium K23_9]